jgi:type II secretory ATPase GspE/PulE/Tfp pilus assembly ATPase PilB-like protein
MTVTPIKNGTHKSPPVIQDFKSLPEGEVISSVNGPFPLATERREHMAVIQNGHKEVILLTTPDFFGKAAMLDTRQALIRQEYKVQVLFAIRDVINHAYQKDEARSINRISNEATAIEDVITEIVELAIRKDASDIHIETRDTYADVLFRINGIRETVRNITTRNAEAIAQVLYSVHADASSKDVSWNKDELRDGAIEWNLKSGQKVQMRFSSAPIFPSGNFHIVIRLLSMEFSGIGLNDLGYEDEQRAMVDVFLAGASGMVILCGPTNSGKSTTMQAMMKRLYEMRGDSIKMVTVEDPVEYVIPGACQIPVSKKKKGSTEENGNSAFTSFLKGTLRQDPDTVMVGEIRDSESAVVVKDLVLAGRKVVTTLHTYSALWSFVRLKEIGVPMELLTMPGFISGIVYQRLVPLLCPKCSIPLAKGSSRLPQTTLYRLQQVADFATDNIHVKGDGCPHCKMTGIGGRTIVAEFLIPDRVLLGHMAKNQYQEAEQHWLRNRTLAMRDGVTVLSHALHKMKKGLIDPSDVETYVALLTQDLVMEDAIIIASKENATLNVKQRLAAQRY